MSSPQLFNMAFSKRPKPGDCGNPKAAVLLATTFFPESDSDSDSSDEGRSFANKPLQMGRDGPRWAMIFLEPRRIRYEAKEDETGLLGIVFKTDGASPKVFPK